MDESLASDLTSMMKAILEAQEREMAWDPTSYHSYESTSTFQEELPYGNYVEEDQYGYDERYQSWDLEHNYEEASPSPIYEQEDIRSMMLLVLEGQNSCNKSMTSVLDAMESALDRRFKNINTHEKTMDESMLMDCQEEIPIITSSTPTNAEDPSSFTLPCAIEKEENKRLSWETDWELLNSWEEESDETQLIDMETSSSTSEESNIIGKDTINDYPLSELKAPKDDLKKLPKEDKSLQEAEEAVRELELLLGCKVEENSMVRYEDPCEDVVVVKCMENAMKNSIVENELSTKEHMHVQPIVKQEARVETPIEKQDNLIELVYKEALGGKEITGYEIREAHALKTEMDCTPPSQLEGTSTPLPCIEKVTSCNILTIDECIDLPCESQDEVDYSLVNSTNLEIDFIFSTNAFDPPSHSNFNEYLRKYSYFVENCFHEYLVHLVWTIVFLLAQMVYCENRRRTKGPLAQPFDSCD